MHSNRKSSPCGIRSDQAPFREMPRWKRYRRALDSLATNLSRR
jgi:hypothetical protein